MPQRLVNLMDREAFHRFLNDPDAFVAHVKHAIKTGFEPLVTQLQAAIVPQPDPPPHEPAPALDIDALFMGSAPVESPNKKSVPVAHPSHSTRPLSPQSNSTFGTKKSSPIQDIPLGKPDGHMVPQSQFRAPREPHDLGSAVPAPLPRVDVPAPSTGSKPKPQPQDPALSPIAVQDISDSQSRLRQREKRISDMLKADRGEVL